MSVNSVAVSGHLGRDPELRQTRGGASVCTLRMCVNGRRRQGEEWVDDPNWIDVVAFGGMAEACAKRLSKGSFACVHGRLSQRTWKAKDGSNRSTVEVAASEVDFGPKAGNGRPTLSPGDVYDVDCPF